MRVLITGACGFVGRHLASELARHGHDLVLTSHRATTVAVAGEDVAVAACEIQDGDAVRRLVGQAKPDAVVHLAGLAHVVEAASDRTRLSGINILGVHHVCSAVASQATKPVSVVFASTALVYGNAFDGRVAATEETPVQPATAYAHSKIAGEAVGRTFETGPLSFYVTRPFNHIGPGQAPSFVAAGFAARIHATASPGQIEVGNLTARRDFCDVRDIVRAYRLILEKQPPSRLFVLGSGRSVQVQEVLDRLLAASGKAVTSRVNQALLRPADTCDLVADTRRAEAELGWRAETPLATSLADVYASLEPRGKIEG